MANILIVGAAGFVGRHLTAAIAREPGHHVIGLGRGRPPTDLPHGTHWIEHDLTAHDLPANMPDRIDAVVHLAQSRRFRERETLPVEVLDINVRSVILLLSWAQTVGAKSFIYASTGGLCGTSNIPISEDAPYAGEGQLGYYYASKYAAELSLRAFSDQMVTVILRPFFVYGQGQNRQMLLPRLVERIRRGDPIQLQGPDGIRINPIHVSDCARAFAKAISFEESHTINVAGPDVVTLREICETIGRCVGRAPVFEIDQNARPGHIVADISRMTGLLEHPLVSIEAGLTDLCRSMAS